MCEWHISAFHHSPSVMCVLCPVAVSVFVPLLNAFSTDKLNKLFIEAVRGCLKQGCVWNRAITLACIQTSCFFFFIPPSQSYSLEPDKKKDFVSYQQLWSGFTENVVEERRGIFKRKLRREKKWQNSTGLSSCLRGFSEQPLLFSSTTGQKLKNTSKRHRHRKKKRQWSDERPAPAPAPLALWASVFLVTSIHPFIRPFIPSIHLVTV